VTNDPIEDSEFPIPLSKFALPARPFDRILDRALEKCWRDLVLDNSALNVEVGA
jgi:hypothetical protein